ncbi:hypothetical protein [Streptomyces microflavus]
MGLVGVVVLVLVVAVVAGPGVVVLVVVDGPARVSPWWWSTAGPDARVGAGWYRVPWSSDALATTMLGP